MPESYLTTHPHIRRIIFGACILIALAALGSMFGWDEVRRVGEKLFEAAGLIEGSPQ